MQNLKLIIFWWMLKKLVWVTKLNFKWCVCVLSRPSHTPQSMAACTDDHWHIYTVQLRLMGGLYTVTVVHCDGCTLCRLPDVSDRQQRKQSTGTRATVPMSAVRPPRLTHVELHIQWNAKRVTREWHEIDFTIKVLVKYNNNKLTVKCILAVMLDCFSLTNI